MAEQTALLPISGGDDPERLADVIFVHGLDGDAPRSTWHPKDQPEHFWPAWLGEEMPQLGVWSPELCRQCVGLEGPQHAACRSRR